MRLHGLIERDTSAASLWGQQKPSGASPGAVSDVLAAWAQ